MAKQIRTIGFRNGLYVGQVDSLSNQSPDPSGIGIAIDDMFLACLSFWMFQSRQSPLRPRGPTLLLYPHRQILYMEQYPTNSKFKGFWCYNLPNLKIFGNGQYEFLAILHTDGKNICKVNYKQGINKIEQFQYENGQQKWRRIQQIIGMRVTQANRSINHFIQQRFTKKLTNQNNGENVFKLNRYPEDFYGLINNNEGILFSLKTIAKRTDLSNVGFYKSIQPKKQISFGRTYNEKLSSSSCTIVQGNFDTGEVYQYQSQQKRPPQSYKISRKYFRQATTFSNKFLQLTEADQIYKFVTKIWKQYQTKIESHYGQRIIEANQRRDQPEDEDKREYGRAQRYKQSDPFFNRQYNLQQAKARIEQQISKKKSGVNFNNTGKFAERTQSYFDNMLASKQQQPSLRQRSPARSNGFPNQILTSRHNRSPLRSSPKKYSYIDENNKQLSENAKVQKTPITAYKNSYNYNNNENDLHPRDYTYRKQYHQKEPIKQFTLYPLPTQQKQLERQIRERNINRDRVLRDIEFKRQKQIQMDKQIQRQMLINYQMQKENDRKLLLQLQSHSPYKRAITLGQNPLLYNPIIQQVNTDMPIRMGSALSPEIMGGNYKRKYFNNYSYIEQKQKQIPVGTGTPRNMDSVTSRNANTLIQDRSRPGYSPISKINPNATTKNDSGRSRSPFQGRSNRKIFSYVD